MTGILGIGVLLGIAFLMSNNRNAISLRVVFWDLGLQLIFAILILKTPIGEPVFGFVDDGFASGDFDLIKKMSLK